ncbi:MAG: DUF790 family protein [Nitrososphaera sp.]|jgi:predicted nuclease of restriction endonuclease-like RecB superfamily
MLAAPLLRVQTSPKKGLIWPLFCTGQEEIELAGRLIGEFQESRKNREKRSDLDSRIAAIESERGIDYKLVRGLASLLERRCTFTTGQEIVRKNNASDPASTDASDTAAATDAGISSSNSSDGGGNNNTILINPAEIRKALFEESSGRGFALTDSERAEIISAVASKWHHLTGDQNVADIMWSDLEDNQILDRFDIIDAKSLVGWYNLSLIQTLLFNCTRLEFSISGGSNWKRILRSVKRLGLMYYLQEGGENDKERRIVCSLEGPSSLFRLTDRYGTALARLLPSIILQSRAGRPTASSWDIRAWVARRTFDGQRTLYEFRLSDNQAHFLLSDPFYHYHHQQHTSNIGSNSSNDFDSAVEEKFARRFAAVSDSIGWTLIREPDPLIVSGGKALIPDFMFEKYGRKVYLEIVGFWTPEYLERKLKKLADIILANESVKKMAASEITDNDGSTITATTPSIKTDLFVAINKDLACSSTALSSLSFHLIQKDRLIQYGGDAVPIRPILEYLKAIDKELVETSTKDRDLKVQIDCSKDVIPVQDIVVVAAAKDKEESGTGLSNGKKLPPEIVLKIALRDYGDKFIEVAGTHLIGRSKAEKLRTLLAGSVKFADACSILAQNDVPESCQAELISKLGYDVIWQSMDPGVAVISKRQDAKISQPS